MGPAMTLLQPDPIPELSKIHHAHFIAIGGAGMSGVASAYLTLGITVSGCDQIESEATQILRRQGAIICIGHHPDHLESADVVVVSTAIQADNPELVEAHRRSLPVWHRSLALAALMPGNQVVAISGTHGKTTTTAMCVAGLHQAGLDPSYVIGGTMMATGLGSHLGSGRQFIVEADESDGSFLQYPTSIAVITTIEADHLDRWGTAQAYADGFRQFATNEGVTTVILNADDPGATQLGDELDCKTQRILRFGQSKKADIRITDLKTGPTGGRATMQIGRWNGHLRLGIPGIHNLYNAAAACCLGEVIGAERDVWLAGLFGFTGTHRRFETVGSAGGVTVIDDYAHHPTEVEASIATARAVATSGRLIVCFQPHLFTRTRDLAAQFGQVLASADEVVVLDVYPAREAPIPGVSGQMIAQAVDKAGGRIHYVPDMEDAVAALVQLSQPGDVIMTIGAGSVTKLAVVLLASLER